MLDRLPNVFLGKFLAWPLRRLSSQQYDNQITGGLVDHKFGRAMVHPRASLGDIGGPSSDDEGRR